MAHGGTRGVRLQLYQWHQEWSLACKVSDTDTTLSYGMTPFCHHSLHCDTTFCLHLIWCIGPLKKPLMLDSFVSFLAKMVNAVCICWMQGYVMSSWLIRKPTHGWSHLVKRSAAASAASLDRVSCACYFSQLCTRSVTAAFWRHFTVLKWACVLAERWRRVLVTFQPLQPYKASSFSLKGISALLKAAWPSSRHAALSQGRISPSAIPEIDVSAWSHNSYLERIKVCSL